MKQNRLKSFFKLSPRPITTMTVIVILILFLIGIRIMDMFELKTYDLRFLSRGEQEPGPNVVAAVIDEKSLDAEGRWPWPRAKIARLIEALDKDGAKVIAFDVGFIEPDENNNIQLLEDIDTKLKKYAIQDPEFREFMDLKKKAADNDRILARSIQDAKAKIILGYFFYMTQEALDYEIDDNEINHRIKLISDSEYPSVLLDAEAEGMDPFKEAYAPEPNLPMFHEAADASGYFNMEPDLHDGIVRTMPLVYKCGVNTGEKYPYAPLSIQAVWNFLDRPEMRIIVGSHRVLGIEMGDRFIPTDELGYMRINYLGPERTFNYFSLTDILNGNFKPGAFRDKIVIIGATAIGLGDIRYTPFSSTGEYPGLEIHATVVDNILRRSHINKPNLATIYDLMAITVLGLLTGIIIPRLSALKAIFAASSLFISYIIINRWLFTGFGLWINLVYPLLTIALVYTSLTVYHYLTEEREKKKIRGAFSYYVSSSVVNEMLKDPSKLKLGGDKKELSVLFSDIRSFTSMSEGMTPEDLVHLLNEYLTVMTEIVFKYDGTLDKYIGDALMAIYGAPLDQDDHAKRACESALDMMDGLKALNEKWIHEGKKPLDIGIGINTGMMMVGNMGSDQRFDYTVMGDAVNLGSRLEGANKSYKTHILISETTYAQIRDDFVCMELDSVRVKGKNLPVKIFELISKRTLPSRDMEAIEKFHEGLYLYKNQEWDKAIQVFKGVNAIDQTLYAAQLYVERCKGLKQAPPGPDWDGVFTMTTK
jgi:adenylate cyclase